MSNIDNRDSVYKIDNCESVYKIERQIQENEEEFIYTLIKPFCETVVEKRLSKAELKQILEKGMQKSISLDKIKQAREEMEKLDLNDYGDNLYQFQAKCTAILDKLIAESEEQHG